MRPIVKKKIGESLLVDNIEQKVTEEYIPYQEAKPLLVSNLGCFCSYCEDAYHQMRDLHVEHIQPKGLQQYKELEHRWENFLLSCATCNGTDNKGNKDVVLSEFYLPFHTETIHFLA
ncbi:MAG: HNH endonuclease [Phocaeicola sp.]